MSTRLPFPMPLAALVLLVAGAPALAQGTSEQRAACTGDAMRLCFSAVPDVGRITACMKSHYGDLSPRCQATFHEEKRSEPPRKLAEEPAKAPAVKQAEAPPAAAPREAARETVRETTVRETPREAARIAPREIAPRQRLARTPAEHALSEHGAIERGPAERMPAEHRAAHHRRDVEGARDVASRELPGRPVRELPAREAAEPPVAAAPAYPAEPETERAPPYPVIAGGPIPAPPLATGLPASAGTLSAACREGLIDPFTCGHTIPTLGLRE